MALYDFPANSLMTSPMTFIPQFSCAIFDACPEYHGEISGQHMIKEFMGQNATTGADQRLRLRKHQFELQVSA